MTYLETLGWAATGVGVYMTGVWLLSVARKDTSIVDVFWGLGFILASLIYLVLTDGWIPRRLLVVTLVCIWGLRLSLHIAARNWGQPEDPRYRAWRDKHPQTWWWRSYVTVFLLQAVILLIVSLPLLSAQHAAQPAHWTGFDLLGAALWVTGFAFEAIADAQLLHFKRDPTNAGRVLDSGLWKYSRHPNYFGETVLWWGFFTVTLSTGGFWTAVGPLLLTILLLKFSGVTLLERSLTTTKPAYADYIRRTSAFLPWPPKRTG